MSTSQENNPASSRFIAWMVVALAVVVADQATKWAIVEWVPLYDRVPLNSFINLTHQKNTGAAFSFLANAGGWQRWFFVVLASIVSAVIAVWIWRIRKEGQAMLSLGLALVLGGAVGNLIDRIWFGHVTDFIQVWFGEWAFPSFNVADAGISVGAALLIIDALFFSGREERGK
ncbi:MAG: signal peptidase II [Gammaproteobacteria bacterium]|nr:signal peptidase II [Gammaproteobacteria bacterium]